MRMQHDEYHNICTSSFSEYVTDTSAGVQSIRSYPFSIPNPVHASSEYSIVSLSGIECSIVPLHQHIMLTAFPTLPFMYPAVIESHAVTANTWAYSPSTCRPGRRSEPNRRTVQSAQTHLWCPDCEPCTWSPAF